jgi:hypothetical protein
MKAEGVARQRNIDILSVRPAGILPADREQQAKCLLGAQAEPIFRNETAAAMSRCVI